MSKTPEDFAVFLNDLLQKSTDTSTIDLISAPCGVGKSYSLTYQIGEALRDYNRRGIILVTDEVQRMEEYPNNQLNSHLYDYISRNRERILIYKSENSKADYSKLFTKQIIILSTQRFFNMTRKEVKQLTDTHIPKRHIFVDERAPLQDVVTIDQETINSIDSLLKKYIDNTARDKEWVLYCWNKFRERMDDYIREYEKQNKGYELRIMHYDSFRAISNDDEKLKRLLYQTYYNDLRSGKLDNTNRPFWDYRQKVQAIFQIVEQGALFVSRKRKNSKDKKSKYGNFFVTVLDHSDLLLNLETKSVILDGTGDIDPVYNCWYINKVDCSEFTRNLSNLTINLVDINTSRNKIAVDPKNSKELKSIIQYVKTLPNVDIIFTYGWGKKDKLEGQNTTERYVHDAGFETDHLGNLRGTNQYKNLKNFVQIGLNRYADEHYFMLGLATELQRYSPDRKSYSIINADTKSKTIMLNSILTDLEQNIFRGVIRNAGSTEKQSYTVLFACKSVLDKEGNETNDLAPLTDMIKDRFGKLGATVNVIDCPEIIREAKIRNRNAEKMTVAQKILHFIDSVKPGQKYKKAEILDAFQITAKTFDKTIAHNKYLKELLDSMRIAKGWYQKPIQRPAE